MRGFNVSEQEINRLRYYAGERKAFAGGRGLWMSGAPAHERLGGAALNNCLAGETRVITSDGIKPIRELSGSSRTILTTGGKWVIAPFKSFGKQHLLKISLQKGKAQKEIFATPEHTWYKVEASTRIPVATASLKPGDALSLNHGQGVKGIRPSPFGVAQGFVFGDGIAGSGGRASGRVVLCGEKDRHLLPYFSLCTTREVPDIGLEVSDLPNGWKGKPCLSESKTFLYGWLSGYFAADGSVKENGQIRLSSAEKSNLEFVRSVCAVLGIGTCPIVQEDRVSNLTHKPHTLYSLTIQAEYLGEEFFIVPEHRRRFIENQGKKKNPVQWKVASVEETERYEEVFCAVVDDTHTFTLEDNILTGNCWALTAEDWNNFVHATDLLMLGGGVGMSVEHRFVSKLPKVKKGVVIEHRGTKDADFIVPDSREGWCELQRRVFEAFFVTGKGFTYSTVCIRGYGEDIKGFGGKASGPLPLIEFVEIASRILKAREGKHIRPVDAADIICAGGAMVKAGNVRRSAIIIMGDPWDKEYLVMKRWDLQTLPPWRSNANFSVVCEEIEDLHPLFWKTYEHGEPYGLINRKNIQTYGRMGEKKKDTAYLVNP